MLPASFRLDEEFVDRYRDVPPPWGFGVLSELTFLRTYSRIRPDGKNEQWFETIRRVVEGTYRMQERHIKANNLGWNDTRAQASAQEMYDRMFHMKFLPPGRGLWAMGSALTEEKGLYATLNNCAMCSTENLREDPCDPFCWLMEASMLGIGVGFDTKGANQIMVRIPDVSDPLLYVIADSREGWVQSVQVLLEGFLCGGRAVMFDYSHIREKGSIIKGFGGVASGPEPLMDLHHKLTEFLSSYNGRLLDCEGIVTICNLIGVCVVSGNVRRTALIAFGDSKDDCYLDLKNYRWDAENGIYKGKRVDRAGFGWTSNNSVFAEIGMDYAGCAERTANNGEPGYVWLENIRAYSRLVDPADYKDQQAVGCNPCQPGFATVISPRGIRTFDEIDKGDVIWSETGWARVSNKWANGIKDVYLYRTSSGSFIGTKEHRVVSSGTKIEAGLCETIDVLTGDIPKSLPPFHSQAIVDGLVLGDGSIHKASNNLIHLFVGAKDGDYFTDQHIEPYLKRHRPGLASGAWEVETEIHFSELVRTFEREIPERYFKGDYNTVRSFLRGLYAANGSICADRVTLKASSKTLVEQVQMMLSFLGIRSRITVNKPSTVKFKNGEYLCKQSYDLNISQDRILFKAIIGFVQKYKQDKLDKLCKTIGSSKYSAHHVPEGYRVLDVTYLGRFPVYDITIDNEPHTYWTGGLNVSNCTEQSLFHKELCCTSYDTKIQTRDGIYQIGDIVGKSIEVWNGIRWSKVTPFLAARNKAIYRVMLSDGSYLDVTDNHRWLTRLPTARKFREVETRDLCVGMIIPEFTLGEISGLSTPRAYEYGLFCGDGYLNLDRPYLSLHGPKRRLCAGIAGKVLSEQQPEGYHEPFCRINMTGVLDVDLCKKLRETTGIPAAIFSWDLTSIRQFLAGYIDTDGSLSINPNAEGYRVFGSEEKMRDLQLLLRRIGINHATVYRMKGQKSALVINGQHVQRNYAIWVCQIPSFECGNIPTRLKVAKAIASRYARNNRHPQGTLIDRARKQKIVSIEYIGHQDAFCFTEPERGMGVFGNALTFQCLVENFLNRHDDLEDFQRTLKFSYMYAKTVTLGQTHWEETNRVMLKNRRIGCSISGIQQFVAKHGLNNLKQWCEEGYKAVCEWDRVYSNWFCIPESIKKTSVKPSGTVSLIAGATPGMHWPEDLCYIRRIRIAKDSDLVSPLRRAGYTIEPCLGCESTTVVVEIPIQLADPKLRPVKDVSIWEQASMNVLLQKYWADNQVSNTVSFDPVRESQEVRHVLDFFQYDLKAISFLPRLETGAYPQMPYEPITRSRYDQIVKSICPVDFSNVSNEEADTEKFCDGEACTLR